MKTIAKQPKTKYIQNTKCKRQSHVAAATVIRICLIISKYNDANLREISCVYYLFLEQTLLKLIHAKLSQHQDLYQCFVKQHQQYISQDKVSVSSPTSMKNILRPLLLENVFQVKDFSWYTESGRYSLFIILSTRYLHHKVCVQ